MSALAACDWAVEVCEDCCSEAASGNLPPEQWEMVQAWAVDFLWRATGKMFGLCETTFRPCRRNCDGSVGLGLGAWISAPWLPVRFNNEWINLRCGSCVGECGCSTISEIRLPDVHAVTGIRINGVNLEPSGTVAVYNRNRIVRIDGDEWPACQNLAQVDGEGSWSVTVQQGLPVPPGGAIVAGLLACEFAKACTGSDGCRLPERIQTITRNGVTIGFQDSFDQLTSLTTGIFEIDAFIHSARSARFGRPSVRSVDRPPPNVLTWPVSVLEGLGG